MYLLFLVLKKITVRYVRLLSEYSRDMAIKSSAFFTPNISCGTRSQRYNRFS